VISCFGFTWFDRPNLGLALGRKMRRKRLPLPRKIWGGWFMVGCGIGFTWFYPTKPRPGTGPDDDDEAGFALV